MPAPDQQLLCHSQCFYKDQRKKDRCDFEPDTMSSFQKTPASHWRVNTYSAQFWPNRLKNMSVNSEDGDVDFAFPDFNLAWFEWERSWCRNWIVTFPWKKIWSVFENFNADHAWRREWTGRNSRGFPKKINERILRQWQQTYLEKLLCLLQCFFLQGPTEERWKRLRERHNARFPNTPALH